MELQRQPLAMRFLVEMERMVMVMHACIMLILRRRHQLDHEEKIASSFRSTELPIHKKNSRQTSALPALNTWLDTSVPNVLHPIAQFNAIESTMVLTRIPKTT
jgi:hypothetical protein